MAATSHQHKYRPNRRAGETHAHGWHWKSGKVMIWTQGPRSPYLFTLCPFITYKTVALPVTTREHRAAIPRLHRAGARVRRLPRHGCVLTSEVKACGVELVRVPSPCHDSPFLVHLVKPAEAASQPASRCHKGIRACSHASLAPPGLLPHAAEALKETLPSARTRSGVRYVCGLSWRFIYMSLEWFLSCSIFLPPPSLSTSSLYLTCSQAYAIASQSFYKKHFILHSELPRVSIGDNNGAAFGAAPRHSCVAM